jgi:hypothetical protein
MPLNSPGVFEKGLFSLVVQTGRLKQSELALIFGLLLIHALPWRPAHFLLLDDHIHHNPSWAPGANLSTGLQAFLMVLVFSGIFP